MEHGSLDDSVITTILTDAGINMDTYNIRSHKEKSLDQQVINRRRVLCLTSEGFRQGELDKRQAIALRVAQEAAAAAAAVLAKLQRKENAVAAAAAKVIRRK